MGMKIKVEIEINDREVELLKMIVDSRNSEDPDENFEPFTIESYARTNAKIAFFERLVSIANGLKGIE